MSICKASKTQNLSKELSKVNKRSDGSSYLVKTIKTEQRSRTLDVEPGLPECYNLTIWPLFSKIHGWYWVSHIFTASNVHSYIKQGPLPMIKPRPSYWLVGHNSFFCLSNMIQDVVQLSLVENSPSTTEVNRNGDSKNLVDQRIMRLTVEWVLDFINTNLK